MITPGIYEFISLDVPALFSTICVALTCALLGNFLVLRKISLMGDAISHAVLPGIVFGFVIAQSRAGLPIFIGAALAGILCSLLIEFVKKLGKVDSGASMGVIFSIFFAAGVLFMEQVAASSVDLDADCVLHGQLELLFWSPPSTWVNLFSFSTLSKIPTEVPISFLVLIVVITCIVLFYKELKITAFDSELATSLGFNSQYIHYGYMVLVAAAVVSSFQIVGSILVIAMIICPAAAARLLSDKLSIQIYLSLLIALFSSIAGYYLAAFGPALLGYTNSISAAGTISVMLGVCFATSLILAPRYGLIAKRVRNFRLSVRVGAEDILGSLFRLEETSNEDHISKKQAVAIAGSGFRGSSALNRVISKGFAHITSNGISLSKKGREQAKSLIRSHRLWEAYLEKYVGLDPSHVHPSAEQLEHFTDSLLVQKLTEETGNPKKDPHGENIPE